MGKPDVYIIGAGFYGAVLANRIAEELKLVVAIIDKRDHIGGNAYSEFHAASNSHIHKYGSHIFHTNSEEVWSFINQFGEFNNYRHTVLANYHDEIYQLPFCLHTLNKLYGKNLNPLEAEELLKSFKSTTSPRNLEEQAISLVGEKVYEALIKGYTRKQWQRDPKELPSSIIKRLPVRYNYNTRYFRDKYEGIPVNGYTKIFENMLKNPLISTQLGVDFFDCREELLSSGKLVIYTGAIDQFFDYKYGKLGWRSVRFEEEELSVKDFQGTAVINYTSEDVPFTRIHEFKHYNPEREMSQNTLIYKEYSVEASGNADPYYPIGTNEDKELFKKYYREAMGLPHVLFGGRLGSYAYMDMDQTIAASLSSFKKTVRNLLKE